MVTYLIRYSERSSGDRNILGSEMLQHQNFGKPKSVIQMYNNVRTNSQYLRVKDSRKNTHWLY